MDDLSTLRLPSPELARIRRSTLLGILEVMRQRNSKVQPGIFILEPWPGAQPGMRVR